MEQTCTLFVNQPNIRIPRTINDYDNIPICLHVIHHDSLQVWFKILVFDHCVNELCPHDPLRFNVFKLHIPNINVHDFVINRIIYMASHCCLVDEVLDMVKHDQRILQISPSYIYMQLGLLCSQPCQSTSWKWRPWNQKNSLKIDIHRCNGSHSWISIQGCC
jgi:hypothetical protein